MIARKRKEHYIGTCNHCHRRGKFLEARGLCRRCYRDDAVRDLYPPKHRHRKDTKTCRRCYKSRRIVNREDHLCAACDDVRRSEKILEMGDGCVHCAVGKPVMPRGLCRRCFYTPGLRKKYPLLDVDYHLARPLPDGPTGHPPGSPGKVEVMARRVAAGRQPHHPDDYKFTEALVERMGIANAD